MAWWCLVEVFSLLVVVLLVVVDLAEDEAGMTLPVSRV